MPSETVQGLAHRRFRVAQRCFERRRRLSVQDCRSSTILAEQIGKINYVRVSETFPLAALIAMRYASGVVKYTLSRHFAYDVFGDGKTSVRGGGIFCDSILRRISTATCAWATTSTPSAWWRWISIPER